MCLWLCWLGVGDNKIPLLKRQAGLERQQASGLGGLGKPRRRSLLRKRGLRSVQVTNSLAFGTLCWLYDNDTGLSSTSNASISNRIPFTCLNMAANRKGRWGRQNGLQMMSTRHSGSPRQYAQHLFPPGVHIIWMILTLLLDHHGSVCCNSCAFPSHCQGCTKLSGAIPVVFSPDSPNDPWMGCFGGNNCLVEPV